MTEAERIADQLRRACEGEAWHGQPLKEILAGITAEQAARRVVPNTHTIWELVLHIGAWESIVRRRLGGEAVSATPEMDWPPVRDTSEAAWKNALDALERGNLQLRQAIAALSDDQLRQRSSARSTRTTECCTASSSTTSTTGQIAILKAL
jgi:hypothetical protein